MLREFSYKSLFVTPEIIWALLTYSQMYTGPNDQIQINTLLKLDDTTDKKIIYFKGHS